MNEFCLRHKYHHGNDITFEHTLFIINENFKNIINFFAVGEMVINNINLIIF